MARVADGSAYSYACRKQCATGTCNGLPYPGCGGCCRCLGGCILGMEEIDDRNHVEQFIFELNESAHAFAAIAGTTIPSAANALIQVVKECKTHTSRHSPTTTAEALTQEMDLI